MADDFDDPQTPPAAPASASTRPEPKRDRYGRYLLPPPGQTGHQSWQRATTLIKYASDTYHLDLWKQRSVAKGVASKPALAALAATLDVKRDKDRLNKLVSQALEAAGATAAADLGTALHAMAETMDETGSMDGIPELYRPRMLEYNAALRAKGITIIPDMIERITVSERWGTAGTLDRCYRLADGSNVIGDLKTGSTLDFGFKEIEAQLAIYEDGVNTAGVWTGTDWDRSLRVRQDIGLVVHLPSDQPGVCNVYVANLENGRRLLAVCSAVREERKHKSPLEEYGGVAAADGWEERFNAAVDYEQLVLTVQACKRSGSFTTELSRIARRLAGELR